jgi:hypothetical protein
MDLEEVRWKLADELNENEKEFLNEHKEELNDAEKNAFKSFLETDEQTPDPVTLETKTDEEENGEEEKDPESAEGAEGGAEGPITFNTPAEREAWLQAEIAKRQPITPVKVEETPEDTKSPFEIAKESLKGKKYSDASEAYADFVATLKTQADLESKAQQKVNEKFEAEYKEVAEANKLPDPSTEEGKKIKDAITNIGVNNGKKNYREAYDLYTKIPEQFGGGFKVIDQKKKADDNKKQIEDQKKKAALMGGSTPAGDDKKKGIGMSYEKLHNTDMDNLLEI